MLNDFKKILAAKGEIYLRIKARPGASATAIKQILRDQGGEMIKLDLAAPAVKGKANSALIKFLAGQFDVPKNSVRIISGGGEKMKLVKIVK